jgi:hypothetical protein
MQDFRLGPESVNASDMEWVDPHHLIWRVVVAGHVRGNLDVLLRNDREILVRYIVVGLIRHVDSEWHKRVLPNEKTDSLKHQAWPSGGSPTVD